MLLNTTKVLVVSGLTATGKTKFGLELAKKFNGEIVSADSRQVYTGRNIITGKDLPANLKPQISNLKWQDRYFKYYEINGIKIWLYDVVEPGEDFNVSFWRECAHLVIQDIVKRGKLPIVVGGTGLFIKSLIEPMFQADIPINRQLRQELEDKSPDYLFEYLNKLNSDYAHKLNASESKNPRRLMRAIEIAKTSTKVGPRSIARTNLNVLCMGLTASKEVLFERVNKRVEERIVAGAATEDTSLAADPEGWKKLEHNIVRQQLTWFKKQPNISWFDVTTSPWRQEAIELVQKWYNNTHAKTY